MVKLLTGEKCDAFVSNLFVQLRADKAHMILDNSNVRVQTNSILASNEVAIIAILYENFRLCPYHCRIKVDLDVFIVITIIIISYSSGKLTLKFNGYIVC